MRWPKIAPIAVRTNGTINGKFTESFIFTIKMFVEYIATLDEDSVELLDDGDAHEDSVWPEPLRQQLRTYEDVRKFHDVESCLFRSLVISDRILSLVASYLVVRLFHRTHIPPPTAMHNRKSNKSYR